MSSCPSQDASSDSSDQVGASQAPSGPRGARSPARRDLSNRARGNWGEARAAAHYRNLGFRVLDTGWRAPERELQGDIDLVLAQGGLIVFCEVKARRSSRYGGAATAVTATKQAQVRSLAESWLRVAGSPEVDVRFDVVAIDGVELTHYEAAF